MMVLGSAGLAGAAVGAGASVAAGASVGAAAGFSAAGLDDVQPARATMPINKTDISKIRVSLDMIISINE